MKFGKKVRIIIKKKINSELVYNKKYLKAEKINTKENFQCYYNNNIYVSNIPVILIDSVYAKNENYYAKVFLEKHYLFW